MFRTSYLVWVKRLEKNNEIWYNIWYNICIIKVKNAYDAGEMKEMNKPHYIDWLIEEKGVVLEGTHEVKSYRIDYSDDSEVIDDWALHIRRNYMPSISRKIWRWMLLHILML